jgi:hypothetical protein
MFVTAAVGILVRFISNLASGDLLCIVNDLSDNTTSLDINSISGPFHVSLSAYAAQEPGCRDKVGITLDPHCCFSQGFQQQRPPYSSGSGQLRCGVHADAGECLKDYCDTGRGRIHQN